MRQVGVLAAAVLVGLGDAVEKLTMDHENAKCIAQGKQIIKGHSPCFSHYVSDF